MNGGITWMRHTNACGEAIMERACYGHHGGKLVTVSEFLGKAQRTYKEHGVFPYCPACGEIVQVYGAHSIATTQRFDHQDAPGTDPVDDCPLANRGDARFKYLVPRDWDFQAGKHLRRAFFEDENLKKAYSFCRFFSAAKEIFQRIYSIYWSAERIKRIFGVMQTSSFG